MEEKLKALLSDEAFVRKLIQFETPEEVQACLAEKDVEVSVDDIRTARELLIKKVNGELTDEELEKVQGGLLFCTIFLLCGALVLTSAFVTHCAVTMKDERRRW